MRAPEKNIKSINSVLDDCFRSLAETGLEKASVRSFYKATNLSSSSLYYRFESKDEIIIEATYNRLYSITNDLFFCAAENIGSFESLAQKFLASADEYKKDIRVIYQVLSSPVYGKELKRRTETLKPFYRRIAALISEELGCQSDELFPFVTLFISVIREYILWEDRETTERNLRYLYEGASRLQKQERNEL